MIEASSLFLNLRRLFLRDIPAGHRSPEGADRLYGAQFFSHSDQDPFYLFAFWPAPLPRRFVSPTFLRYKIALGSVLGGDPSSSPEPDLFPKNPPLPTRIVSRWSTSAPAGFPTEACFPQSLLYSYFSKRTGSRCHYIELPYSPQRPSGFCRHLFFAVPPDFQRSFKRLGVLCDPPVLPFFCSCP